MAKKYYDDKITLQTDWGGDESTNNLPVAGNRVQEVIKESINSKVGYVGRVEKTGQGFYVLTRDEETFNTYLNTISDENPFGDLTMDGVNGRFDAPFNYKMNITLINPENGYKSTLVGSTGNVIKFKAETLDNNNTPQGESITITFKVKTEGGVETTYTAIYDGDTASKGIEYNLDDKLGAGINTITITAVGMNTGISAMRRITYRLIDMYIKDKFDISKRYQFDNDNNLAITIGYDLKGVGKTKILWYFDGNHYATDEITNLNPILLNSNRTFYFREQTHAWLTPGVHNIQISMICKDNDSGEEFQTPIYYREFIVEQTPTVLTTPYIVKKTSFDSIKGFLKPGETPTIYNAKQFENVEIEFAAYYNGKSNCKVTSYIKYNGEEMQLITSEELPLISESFSEDQKKLINLNKEGSAEIILRANYGDDLYYETLTNLEISASDMNITTITENVVLDLNAFGRSNNTSGKDIWEYKYLDNYGVEQVISTDFSKNEYAVISTYDNNGNIVAPNDATIENSLVVNELPIVENVDYKYLIYNNEYYIWNREFDWSNTSGWSDNKLKLANGNAITINYKPFSEDKLATIKANGATFEFEFETTNVYNDDAVICRICGNENFAPGIVITASGAELVISREIVSGDGVNAGYTKKVSTKYKAEESNRISFVITPDSDTEGYRNRILSIYVNGELSGAYAYDHDTNFFNDSKITFRGNEDACVNISSIKIYAKALSSNDILNNYIYYRNNTDEKVKIYRRNDIMLESNDENFDSDKLKSQLPVLMIYQIDKAQSLDDIHQEKKNKKLTRFFDVVYIDIQNPSKNFLVKNAYITPQGTSSMNYPVKNLRLYTGKKDKSGEYYSRLFVGSNIFIDGSPSNLSWDNINLDTEVKKKRQYAFKDGAIPVNCWCLKADFAESSSSHNTGTSRYWNNVLKNAGLSTKAQLKAAKYIEEYPYDVRTAIDGFPIVVFYQSLDGSAPRFEGKYNFNNDKSTESVFGFTGGIELDDQEVKYYYIGKEAPIVHGEENDKGEWEWACEFASGGYTETPTVDSPLYASKINDDGAEDWYMLRGIELLDNPKMECWELLNSVNEIALFKTMVGFGTDKDEEKIGIVKENGDFEEAFESRYPDCGDYFHFNSLKRFGEWLVSCRYLDIDATTGASIPFTSSSLPKENYHKNESGKLSICSLTKQTGSFTFNFPNHNFYREINYDSIASNIRQEGYQEISIDDETLETIVFTEVNEIPDAKIDEFEYIKCKDLYYTWMPGNVLKTDSLPEMHEKSYDYVLVNDVYYVWANIYNFEDYHIQQWVDDTAFNRALKFTVEKYDHIEMNKMAAYYIYLMRFGGVDQTVKNSMLTTEGPAGDDANSKLPSQWYFINYDNDTILGVKNDGRLVFDPYITRETKDGTGYVYAGRESTLWNNLEADVQFMDKVTEIDNKLADGGADPLFSLSYTNALREYDINQSDKWCERIYNKDAERKYIDTYVTGWTQKIEADNSVTHVYEDYLYDVQGSRSAHRKWWLGRRFNVFDSRFCNSNFRNQLIKFRSTNLPAGSSFSIVSGEPIFYAWGHDNAVTAITPTAIQPGNKHTFITESAFNIGSYLELMGAANISTLDLRDCVGALTEIDVTGCYTPSVGTKMKEILIGDHKRTDLVNISNTSLKFSGLANASKLEVIDMTNIRNAVSLDGLDTLLNIREVYAKDTSIANFSFANGAMIEKIELPSTVETLSLKNSSNIDYDGIIFADDNYGKLTKLSIDNCSKLMTDPDFVIDWINSRNSTQRSNLSVNLLGIDWTFNTNNYNKLFLFEEVGKSSMSQCNIHGTIEITARLTINDVTRLKKIFGDECFKEGSEVYIKAPTNLYVAMPENIWEGSGDVKCEITTVGTTLSGNLIITASVNEIINGEKETKILSATNGIITMDESNLDKGYVTINVLESSNVYEYLMINATYIDEDNFSMMQAGSAMINKRIYPNAITIVSDKDSYNNMTKNKLSISYTPNSINDINLDGRGKFEVSWSMLEEGSSPGFNSLLELTHEIGEETAFISAPNGFDGNVTIQAIITRKYDNTVLASNKKVLEFTNPNTIITTNSNGPIAKILIKKGIIKTDETGFGKLTKYEASGLTMKDFIDENGKSIFAGNTEIESFLEFQYFNNPYMGQMPQEGASHVLTPDGMFKGCTNLKEIAFSDNFLYTGEGGPVGYQSNGMFEGCVNLEHIYGSYNEKEDSYNRLSIEYIGNNFAKSCYNLKTCLLTSNTKYIGGGAFDGCINLEIFQLPTISDAKIFNDDTNSAFQNCENITFEGVEYGDKDAKYQVKNGACYEINSDNIRLIHMGKNTKVSDIPTDKTIYVSSYAMEYRKEDDIVIPSNIIFDGSRIFNNSTGNSITLKNIIGSSRADFLFANTRYGGNYHFADGETTIPTYCFGSVGDMTYFDTPKTVTKIMSSVFYGASGLKNVVLSPVLTEIGSMSFWLTSLETITFTSPNVPSLPQPNDMFYNIMPKAIYVYPEYVDYYKEHIDDKNIINDEKIIAYSPFVIPSHLPSTGYVRIIKDSELFYGDENNILKLGDGTILDNTSEYNGYMHYEVNDIVKDITVYLNEKPIGQISGEYTTLYIGDNSNLIMGGTGFRIGVYDENIQRQMNENGWEYDARFKGIRSNPEITNGDITKISFTRPADDLSDDSITIVHGLYCYTNQENSRGGSFIDDSNDRLLMNYKLGFYQKSTLTSSSNEFEIGYIGADGYRKEGINGLVLHEIGNNVVYTDPYLTEPVTPLTLDEPENNNVKIITVDLNAPVNIPNVYVTLTDNKLFTFSKQWTGETLYFVLPSDRKFIAKATNFIDENGKEYFIENVVDVVDNAVNITYQYKKGLTYNNGILGVHTNTHDWYVNLNVRNGIWGEKGQTINNVENKEIMASDANGFYNTKLIAQLNPNSIFADAIKYNKFNNGIVGYIPSYVELEMFADNLIEINNFLTSKNLPIISLENIWISEAFDSENAWNSNGDIVPKDSSLNYYIFGKKII